MEKLKQVNGFWLPATEEHLVPFLQSGPNIHGGPTYQYHKLKRALDLVPKERRRVAVDIGAHCGLWSRVLVHEFERVEAFEPVLLHRECFIKNVPFIGRWALWPFALGAKDGEVSLHSGPNSSGDTYVKDGGEHSAQMKRLDSFAINVLDFLKLDTEGYEYLILKGGEDTIRHCKPVIIVEQKPGKGSQFGLQDTAAVDLLGSWGATHRFTLSGDYCFSWAS